jgi:hypothetical protein
MASIMMHAMIALTMDLHFTGNMAVALIFLVNMSYCFGVEGREPTSTEQSASLEPAVT